AGTIAPFCTAHPLESGVDRLGNPGLPCEGLIVREVKYGVPRTHLPHIGIDIPPVDRLLRRPESLTHSVRFALSVLTFAHDRLLDRNTGSVRDVSPDAGLGLWAHYCETEPL